MQPQIIDNYRAFAPELALQNSHFDPDNFAYFAQLEQKNFWFCARNKLINFGLQKYFAAAQTFLEIGCGTGFVLANIQKKFPKLMVSGSDIYVTSLPYAQARLRDNANLFQMDARNIPFANEFDVIGLFDVLEHIQEDTVVLTELHKALKPGGGVILTVPQHPTLWSKADIAACHVRRYKIKELQQKLVAAGFKIRTTTSFVFLLLPLMAIARLFAKKEYNPNDELVVNKWLNLVLEQILTLEVLLIKLGLRFPIGGTRFVVATKI